MTQPLIIILKRLVENVSARALVCVCVRGRVRVREGRRETLLCVKDRYSYERSLCELQDNFPKVLPQPSPAALSSL